MIAYEILAKKASPKAMAVIPLRMLMPNGYMDTNIPSLFTELRYTGDVFDRISVTANDTVISLYGYPNQLTRGFPTTPEKDANSDMFKRTCHSQFEGFRYVHIVLLICLKEKHTRFASPLARGE